MKFLSIIVFVAVLLLFTSDSHAQPRVSPERADSHIALHKKKHKNRWEAELNMGACYFPIYDLGGDGYYKLDGKRLMRSDLQYYCALPGQRVWAKYTTDPTDQATVLTGTVTVSREGGFNSQRRFHFIVGITHDKAQTNNTGVGLPLFRFKDGGGEVSVLANYGWQIGDSIRSVTKDDRGHLKIEICFQAGPIIAFNED